MTKKQTTIEDAVKETVETVDATADTVETVIDVPAETGTELVEAQEVALALTLSDDDFLSAEEAENADEFVGIDRMNISQKGKDEGSVLGQFYIKSLTQAIEGFTGVLLRTNKSRIMWPAKFAKDNDPLCKSNDAITPVTDDDTFEAKAASCKTCPYGKWKRNKDGNIPPACGEVLDMIILNTDEMVPVIYSVHATALGATNQELLKALRGKVRALAMRRKRLGLPTAHSCMFSFKIDTKLKENESGDAYVPTYSGIEELDLAQIDMTVHAAKTVKDVEIHFNGKFDDEEEGEGVEEGEKPAF